MLCPCAVRRIRASPAPRPGGRTCRRNAVASVASLRDLLGMTSAHEWRRRGVEIPALGESNNRIHPHYGVFSPVRGEYIVNLVANTKLPDTGLTALCGL
jgi:hypothetical protein